VGSSGNTSKAHLHIHAVRAASGTALDGEGVPILLMERFQSGRCNVSSPEHDLLIRGQVPTR
jgi:hypothetical protein